MLKNMKIIGAFLISLIPIIIGIKKYMVLVNKATVTKEIFEIFSRLLDKIKYSQKELYYILQKENNDYFVFSNPVILNSDFLLQNGLKKQEILIFKEFLKAVQSGDRAYVNSQGEAALKEIEGLKNTFEKELKETGKLYITVFLGVSAIIFLALI